MRVSAIETERPVIHYEQDGFAHEIHCGFIAGCDGFHGIARPAMPADVLKVYERVYPFGWLGILARAAPASDELIYANHETGFALLSMRTPEISRLYIQVEPDDDIANWSDARIWDQLHLRLETPGFTLKEGEVFQKNIVPLRSFVAEPMQHGRLYLAGDAAHIVPPTGAKGLNLAAHDVWLLAQAFRDHFKQSSGTLLERYSALALRRIWRAQRFSWWMTTMLHRFHTDPLFDYKRQLAELDYLTTSDHAMASFAEQYTGQPFRID
jgi:p-hydroxybenzoate 3-monooxygenase